MKTYNFSKMEPKQICNIGEFLIDSGLLNHADKYLDDYNYYFMTTSKPIDIYRYNDVYCYLCFKLGKQFEDRGNYDKAESLYLCTTMLKNYLIPKGLSNYMLGKLYIEKMNRVDEGIEALREAGLRGQCYLKKNNLNHYKVNN